MGQKGEASKKIPWGDCLEENPWNIGQKNTTKYFGSGKKKSQRKGVFGEETNNQTTKGGITNS